MTKAPKPLKPSKAAKQQRKNPDPFAGSFLHKKSQEYIKEVPDAKPFEDMAIVIIGILGVLIWRLSVSVKSQHQGSIDVWTLLTFGMLGIVNIWSFFLGMVSARRRGDIGLMRITEGDMLRFALLSGVFGVWGSTLLFRFKPEDKFFYPKLLVASVLNVFWVVVYIRYYMV
ncbi:MAG: hypothetical protein J3Q66DRAFT_165895 [Benniella sp.]|nr:MAG: hypothetical protein J3Q66DRAFT_165895 [Benniella sp.]